METDIFLLVIFASILHASWNGMVKKFKDKIVSVSAIVYGHVPIAILVMFFVPLPTLKSLPYIILSAVIHQGYQWYLISAYKFGNLTKAYPIARGTGPVVATIISILFLGVLISNFKIFSILLICCGIFCLGILGEKLLINKKVLFYSIATGIFIGLYSLVDGYGARISLSPLSFLGWSFALNAVLFTLILKYNNHKNILSKTLRKAKNIFWLGGTLSYLVYAIVVWCFTKAPIPLVAALRETSIVFSVIIGIFFLKEKVSIYKIASIALIFIGVITLKAF